MDVIKQKMITDPLDILEADIINFHHLNGYWTNPKEALEVIFNRFNNKAVITYCKIPNFLDAPVRNDFPGWDHVGNHESIGSDYWNWFFWNHPGGKLTFNDSPDFWGTFPDGENFYGDIGRVSPSAFSQSQLNMRAHDLWVSVLGNGCYQILIETQVSIRSLRHDLPYRRRNQWNFKM